MRPLVALLIVSSAATVLGEPAPGAKDGFEKTVRPFLAKHCVACHDEREARAGFRVDRLGVDLAEAGVADAWLEVMDKINLGEMPPKDEPRPDAETSFVVVTWIGDQLRFAEKAARSAGGRIPMRRLNRDEYANTVRDLLKIDPRLLAPIVEDLPGDGRAEGFDRLGAALFFDRTQLERSLAAAERIADLAIVNAAPPPKHSVVWQPEQAMEAPEERTEYEPYSGVRGHLVRVGAQAFEKSERGVRWWHGLDVRDDGPPNDPWMRMAWQVPDLEAVVTRDGWYRIRMRAGGFTRSPREPVRVQLDYAAGTPIQETILFEVPHALDEPDVVERTVFLRRGPDGVQRRLDPWWNPDRGLVADTPEHHRHLVATIGLEEQIEVATRDGRPEKEVNALRDRLREKRRAAAAFKGPVREFRGDLTRAPKLFVDWILVDGPYPSGEAVYEPDVRATRFEAEAERGRTLGIRPERETEDNRFVVDRELKVRSGPRRHEIGEDGVTFRQGGPTYEKGNPFGRIGTATIDDLVTEDGYYRVRVRAGVDAGTRGEPIRLAVAYNFKTPQETVVEVPVKASIDEPGVVETTLFLRRGAPDQRRKITLLYNDERKYIVSTPTFNQLFQDTIGTVGKIQRARTAGDKAEVERLTRFLADARQRAADWDGPARHVNPEFAEAEPPLFFLDWMEFEGPVQEQWPPKSHRTLLFDGDERADLAYAREIVERFLPRAYRRPVAKDEVDRVVELIDAELDAGRTFHEALRIGLARILVSPGFLFVREPRGTAADGPRPLDDYEVATRLSYFLWSTMPDDELFDLAKAGRLRDRDVLRKQVDRMIADPRSNEFVENFGGQWLNVREFGSVMPAEEYRNYDAALEESSKREALAFVGEVLSKDLPITTFLDSDFVMVDERLARHYGIDGVEGNEIRRVAIGPEHHRGGVLGMAGLLTLLADGTRTLPVRRANWIVSNLFNDPPPPPPPNAGEVQPNTAGETLTVRERLERHRDEPTCASCHATLDPFGLALENYDAVGAWRTKQNGEGIRGRNAPDLDVSGALPSGRTFDTLEEFKAALLAEKDRFERAFAERLLTYALCRPVGYADRETVDELTAVLAENDSRIQPLIHAIVLSEPFLTK